MYYGRKAEPRASKLLYDAERAAAFRKHKKRLRNIKPSIDTKAPRRFKHLERNLKREQLLEERYAKIEHENRILLSKMSDIMAKPSEDMKPRSLSHSKSLNRVARKRELQRITMENQAILHRIQTVEPMYNHWQWEEEDTKRQKLVSNICEYPVPAGKGDRQKGRGGSLRAAGGMSMTQLPGMTGGPGGPPPGAMGGDPSMGDPSMGGPGYGYPGGYATGPAGAGMGGPAGGGYGAGGYGGSPPGGYGGPPPGGYGGGPPAGGGYATGGAGGY